MTGFNGFAKWLRGPTSRDVTLEVIGLVKGTKELKSGYNNVLGSEAVAGVIKRAQTTLKDNQGTLRPDVEKLLKSAIETFKPVAQMQSSLGTGEFVYSAEMPVEVRTPSPEWKRAFDTARAKLDVQATRVFSHYILPPLKAEIDGMSEKQLAKKHRQDPDAMALVTGHIPKVRAPG